MDIRFAPLDLSRIDGLRFEALVLPFFTDERPLRGAPGLCDWRLCGRLSRWLLRGRFVGSLGEVTLLPGRPRLPFDKLLLFGAGPSESFDPSRFDTVIGHILHCLGDLGLRSFVLALPGRGTGLVAPGEAIRWFLAATGERDDLDDVVILDDPDAQRVMIPVVEAERRRVRARREVQPEG